MGEQVAWWRFSGGRGFRHGCAAQMRAQAAKDNPPMHPTALLEAQTELVHRVLRFEQPADRVVADFFREQRALGVRDRHVLADGAFALVRRLPLWRHLADAANGGRGEIDRRLAILAWQGNAGVLRAALDERECDWVERCRAFDLDALPERLRHNLPDWLAEPIQARLGSEFWPWLAAIDSPAPLDLRVNALKADRDEILARLHEAGIEAVATTYSPLGLRVVGKPALQKLDVFEHGLVEVQDEGSQLLALLTGAKRGEMVVDFCAGAGGKTLALGAQMRITGRLYAFDVSDKRLTNLAPRLKRSGLSNVFPQRISGENDAKVKRLRGKIDRVLVDAPCTGLGTLRRNPDLKTRQNVEGLAELNTKQRAILDAAAALVKPGGRLVYGTCSLLAEENEDIVTAFLAAHPDFKLTPVKDILERQGIKLKGNTDYLRLYPHVHDTDGFFAAVLERAAK